MRKKILCFGDKNGCKRIYKCQNKRQATCSVCHGQNVKIFQRNTMIPACV